MTLIAYVRTGGGSGIGLADSRLTYTKETERTYSPRSRKIRRIGTSHSFVAFAGDSESARRIMELAHRRAKDEKMEYATPEALGRLVMEIYASVRREAIKNIEMDSIGATWEDYTQGKLGRAVRKKIDDAVRSPSTMFVQMLIGGAQRLRTGEQADEFELYRIDPPGKLSYPRGFDVIGDGQDIAEPIIAEFMEHAPITGEIPMDHAMMTLMRAKTEAQKRNPGVGGPSRLIFVDRGRYREIGIPDTAVMEGALSCLDNGIMKLEDTRTLFEIAAYGGRDRRLERMMKFLEEKVDKDLLFDLFFRGNLNDQESNDSVVITKKGALIS